MQSGQPPLNFQGRAVKIPIHRLVFKPILSHHSKDSPKGDRGLCYRRERVIKLDPRDHNPARVYVHELIHLKHPDWSETRVNREERAVWRVLTWKDKARLYIAMGKAIIG